MPGRDEWLDIAAGNADDVRERILTGYKDGKPFTPYVPTVAVPPVRSVLDFGCGLGRNFPYLKSIATHVEGFDLPPMVARCRELATEQVSGLNSDWSVVRTRHYDLIFASLVLQHIETDTCRQLLADFAAMAPSLYLLTRAHTDFGAVMLDLVAASNAFRETPCRVVDHDRVTHQLRVIREVSFDEARRSHEDVHYELLLPVR